MNDSELAILALVAELKGASGYGLAALARARGMKQWAGLSASSVYKGLRRLENDGLVRPGASDKKHAKGPPGRVYKVTAAGTKALRRRLSDGLRAGPEQSAWYRLSLAFIEVVGVSRSVEQLHRRLQSLQSRIEDVERARVREGDSLPLGASLIFEYVLHGLKEERAVTSKLIALLKVRSPA